MPPSVLAPKLVVGLGNPGPQYVQTRHNAGFWLTDELAYVYGGSFRTDNRFSGDICRIRIADQELWLLKPTIYMNRSGQSVVRMALYYKIPPAAILVVHDDLDLPPGTVRLKHAGGHGGHNGLRDTMRHLGTQEFLRLRLGIGHPGTSRDVVDYVLTRAPAAEQQAIDQAIDDAVRAFPLIVQGQLQRAMNDLHRRQPPISER